MYGKKWKMDETDLQAYIGLLILAGVYRSSKEATASLWHAESGRTIFRATMTLKMFHQMNRVLRFDDKDTREQRRARDKLAPIREVWDKWVFLLPMMYIPGANIIVDERLVRFRGRCAFKQFIPSKPSMASRFGWLVIPHPATHGICSVLLHVLRTLLHKTILPCCDARTPPWAATLP